MINTVCVNSTVAIVMHKFPISFRLSSTDFSAPLMFNLYHNQQLIYSVDHVCESTDINIMLHTYENQSQELSWVMAGKKHEHTKLDKNGKILRDAALITENFKLDNFELGHKLIDHCVYCHDNNGNTEISQNTYDHYMGCNGQVFFSFSSPAYIWILKNW